LTDDIHSTDSAATICSTASLCGANWRADCVVGTTSGVGSGRAVLAGFQRPAALASTGAPFRSCRRVWRGY